MHQAFKKIACVLSRYAAFYHCKAQCPAHIDGADHVQTEPCTSNVDNRCLALWCPRGTRMKIRTDAAFILKVYGGTYLFRSFLNRWKHRLFPLLDQFRVLLICTKQWLLTAQPKLAKQPPDGCNAQLYAKLSFDNDSNHCSGPKRKGELHLNRIFIDNGAINPSNLRSFELCGPTSSGTGFQTVPTAGPIPSKPVVNAGSRETQSLYDFFGAFSILDPLYGTDTNFFQCLRAELSSIQRFHGSAV